MNSPAIVRFDHLLLPEGFAKDVSLTIDNDGSIAAVEQWRSGERVDHHYRIGLPGMVNVHSHAFQRAMAGVSEARAGEVDGFWRWRERMYDFVSRLQPEQIGSIAAWAYIEMLEAGFTHVCEFHYLHHEPNGQGYAEPAEVALVLAAAAQERGIGMTLLPVLYRYGGFAEQPPLPAQRRFINSYDSYAKLCESADAQLAAYSPAAKLGFAFHSLRAVNADLINRVLSLAGDRPVHIHAAEQPQEVVQCKVWSGVGPVQWLLDNTDLDGRWCVVHATHMNANERYGLAQSGAVAGLCPITEANLGDGVFDGTAYRRDGGRIAIGSDSNIFIDAAAELASLEYSQRLRDGNRNGLRNVQRSGDAGWTTQGVDLYAYALDGGARASGAGVGCIETGAAASFITLNGEHPSLLADDPRAQVDGWIFSAGRAAIEDVWVNGRQCVQRGRHHDHDDVLHRYRQVIRTLL